jgi:hypothetical protein
VVHVDATHLITNLTAVLPDCVLLEQQCGSAALAADLLLLTTTSHALYGEQQPAGNEWSGSVSIRDCNCKCATGAGAGAGVFSKPLLD